MGKNVWSSELDHPQKWFRYSSKSDQNVYDQFAALGLCEDIRLNQLNHLKLSSEQNLRPKYQADSRKLV